MTLLEAIKVPKGAKLGNELEGRYFHSESWAGDGAMRVYQISIGGRK
jgi:hypothetical protein